MVRETRHLWVGNLPDNIREDRIKDHFKRYGRVQNVKLLGRTESATACPSDCASSGVCATVAFMDIKSASKAHNAEHVLDERTLTTEYYEPAAIPSAAGAPSAGSSPAGSGYSGSSSSVNSAPTLASVARYHLSGGEEGVTPTCAIAATAAAPANWRGTNDSATEYCRRGSTPAAYGRYQRNNSTAPYATPPSNVDRTPHQRWYASGERGATGGESTPSTPGGGTESGRRRRSGSGSSRSESSSPEPSDTSRASTPAAAPGAARASDAPPLHHAAARTPPSQHHHQWSSTASGRPLAICVRNLPTRSTDSSLKDGLYHEYKKHGKVVWVKVVGQNADRYAVVRFKKPSDVEKALEVSQDKLFFGCKISVAPHQSCDEDADSAKPYETDIDEYHPKATRTLFIGNLEKDVTQQQLRDKFKHFGRIIEIDIKKGSGGGAGYAFCQYASISSVVEAIRAMDGEYVGSSRVKLGFGKPVATTCVWVDGLTEHTEKQVLSAVARCGAATSVCVDRAAAAALVHFEQASAAGACVRELRRVAALACAAEPDRHRLAVDYASRECQEAFYEQLEKHGGSAALSASERLSGDLTPRYIPSTRHEQLSRFEGAVSRSRASSYGRASSRTPRYSSLDHYDPADYAADRRYRVYDELGSSPQADETPYEDRLQSVVVSPHRSRRHRRDSSPEDRKHSKERHRSGGATCSSRRSRSGSRGCTLMPAERHSARRRHRRRRDGTPLRDEPLPCEPRRPPLPRPALPMCLPLPKFAAQLLRSAPPAPRPPPPAPAPASPPRAPSASSSSAGSAPHSPSLEERIRSLDEKYEKWSGSRVLQEAPDRARLRHRLLEVDINEVKPSEVVRSLLAKRSVFDEDSERLEGAVRAPSPAGSPHARLLGSAPSTPATPSTPSTPSTPRALRYPFPVHPLPPSAGASACAPDSELEAADRPSDPRLNRPERTYLPERLGKINESDYRLDSRIRLRTPSTDKPAEPFDKRVSPNNDRERVESERDPRKENVERRRLEFLYGGKDREVKTSFEVEEKEVKEAIENIDPDFQSKEKSTLDTGAAQSNRKEESQRIKTENLLSDEINCLSQPMFNQKCIKTEVKMENELSPATTTLVKCEDVKSEIHRYSPVALINEEIKLSSSNFKTEIEKVSNDVLVTNHINKDVEFDSHLANLNALNAIKSDKEVSDLNQAFIRNQDKNGKERHNQNVILEAFHSRLEKENIEYDDRLSDKDKCGVEKKITGVEKIKEEHHKSDRDKTRHITEKIEKDRLEEKCKNSKEKCDREKKSRDDATNEKLEKMKIEKDVDKNNKDKHEREFEKSKHMDEKNKQHYDEKCKHSEEKSTRHDHHRKDKCDKDKRKESGEIETTKVKKEEKHRNERRKDSSESKRDLKKDADSSKSRKSSRDETSRDLNRKDSTDSLTSRTSHDSSKSKDVEHIDSKEETKIKAKLHGDVIIKQEHEKDASLKSEESVKSEAFIKIKSENKVEKDVDHLKDKKDAAINDLPFRCKNEISEKQRHYSLDSPGIDSKRKERLNSCSSLPPNIGHKRRMSSQDSLDSLKEDVKKIKNESKVPERRDSKEARSGEKHKTTKFSKGHFAKIIESKTKDEKKNQVKPPDDLLLDLKDTDLKDPKKSLRKSPNSEEEKSNTQCNTQPERLQHDLDFLATLELRSSEEDEMQKALRKEMKEKKRIQQLQQIQQLQMQQDALHQAELVVKLKDEKKQKSDEKRKEIAREKRMSTDRKSRDEKSDSNKSRNKGRKNLSTDSSDSDEPKKQHSIFDIIDDEPTYISMYDKVKARSCKNMQKQEEEKRQEKIKAKFCQLKQSRAKREEKKRSSWDEDSDSEQDRRKSNKTSMDSSSDDEHIVTCKKREKPHGSNFDYDRNKINEYFSLQSTEEDSRNKLSRKNLRTRIISDTSDDETSKRSKSPSYFGEMRKEFLKNFESLQRIKDVDVSLNDSADKVKKNSLLNLFGKSDSDDSKLKSSLESNDSKSSYTKALCNDFSSESESMASNRNTEIRKKHKKKQKKHKMSISEDDNKINEIANMDNNIRHNNFEKVRRHSNKKEKRKDKARASDVEERRDEKIKPKNDKNVMTSCFDLGVETNSNKKDGKMEDIFGPLSDDSERDADMPSNKIENVSDFTPIFSRSNEQLNITTNSENLKIKDENRRKKDKRKKERRLFSKDDDNSLDVDAVSKAIEARLFADSMTDDDNSVKIESLPDYVSKNQQHDHNYGDINLSFSTDRHDKLKRDSKEKKKKKKRNKEDRQNRKEHHHHFNYEKMDKHENLSEKEISQLSPKTMLLNIPLPKDKETDNMRTIQTEDSNLSESPSLPRLTESPPVLTSSCENTNSKKDSDTGKSNDQNTDFVENNTIEINDIPMPPPLEDVAVQDISDVPLPEETVSSTKGSPEQQTENFMSSFSKKIDVSEDAVRSISNLENDPEIEKPAEKIVNECPCKVDKKMDEKPRAIISQEETEDAVAALLGESFGGKVDNFANCYDETENSSTHQDEIESTTTGTEIIPEEDAEEMRQAVQNLNASEMETKPDTPVSDNDLLLIDTDTEENDDIPQNTIERPSNSNTTSGSINSSSDQPKHTDDTSIVPPKQNPLVQTVSSDVKESPVKIIEADQKIHATKPDSQQITSTATPVITSWTLTNNKLIEPHLLNIQPNHLPREATESKTKHITANIVQIKTPQNQTIASSMRPIITPNRVSAPYHVINQIIRPQVPNMQPPTIKIPEPHILYQKQSGIVISPRMANDSRLQSPKASPQGEGMSSPCLTNMAILSSSQQNLNSVGIASANTVSQRSPGQVTVVRMQQPPLSPIQTMHLPHSARTMVSPNRPNSVLVQTQGSSLHFNRLPITPVLAPISKQMNINNMVQHKGIGISNSQLTHQQKMIPGDTRKNEHRNVLEHSNENSKIILSPTSLQHSTNPTVMAQNRLISMQNSVHSGSLNASVHLTNKLVIGNVNHLSDKNQIKKSESNHIPFGSAPIIHVAGVNHSTASIIQSGSKSVMCSVQEQTSVSRNQSANVIHAINSQKLLTTAPISNVIQIDTSKISPSVLSMATIRSPTVLTKLESTNTVVATTNTVTNVAMTSLSPKPTNTIGTIRLNPNDDVSKKEVHQMKRNSPVSYNQLDDVSERQELPKTLSDVSDKLEDKQFKPVVSSETDFEELLKDTTNEIKKSNDPEKKLEINVGKAITTITTNTLKNEIKNSFETSEKQRKDDKSDSQKTYTSIVTDVKNDIVSDNNDIQEINSIFDNAGTIKSENKDTTLENAFDTDKDSKEEILTKASNDDKKPRVVKSLDQDPIFHNSLSIQCDNSESQIKNDENDPWSSKDINIESVIKKVDSLCNDTTDFDKNDNSEDEPNKTEISSFKSSQDETLNIMDTSTDTSTVTNSSEDSDKYTSTNKRGGRNVRGKKSDKAQDRVQTRQISKTPRGAASAKRGRGGRAKVDKKIKSTVNSNLNNIPGDVYDFHEDSGDESSTSANKSESRPRLILTIKSPLSGQTSAIATSTLSITPKEQQKNLEKIVKDDKSEDFVSPLNTRKSRRLLEKDVQRSTSDDVMEDIVKGAAHNKGPKDANSKKRQTRQVGAKANQQQDKGSSLDTRKSPRGVKRTRDRSLSDASVESIDEKIPKKEDSSKDPKVPKLDEILIRTKTESDIPQAGACPTVINIPVASGATHLTLPIPTTAVASAPTATVAQTPTTALGPAPTAVAAPGPTVVSSASTSVATPTSVAAPAPTPIMKPPKKMISEISAKLASVFEAAASTPVHPQAQAERIPMEIDKPAPLLPRDPRNPELASAATASEAIVAATGEARASAMGVGCAGEAGGTSGERARLRDSLAGGAEASDARVQSPALPHRLPERADRATPLLIRGEVREGEAAGAAGAARRYAGTASLPRGAHLPPPSHVAPHAPHLPHAKQVAVVGPHHHHHPGAASRVSITSVPTISPQGQMAMGEGMYPHFSQQHYQMYQQHFRATQHEARATPSPYTRSLEAEGCEAPTPPLELRRPPSARVPRPAHSPAPNDRLILYAAGCGRSPPPAHGTSRLPGALPPAPPGPPHASQVPREADSLQMLLRRYPVMWQGLLALKNDSAAVQMHFVGGNPGVAGDTLPRHTDGSTPPLRIAQRMRLEPAQLDQVHRKMKLENEHCILLALPCGRDHMDVLQQSTNLTGGFITYLQRKQAAGIVNVAPPGHHQAMYTVHIFPSCDFANENLSRIAPDLMHRVADIAHLLIVIATATA